MLHCLSDRRKRWTDTRWEGGWAEQGGRKVGMGLEFETRWRETERARHLEAELRQLRGCGRSGFLREPRSGRVVSGGGGTVRGMNPKVALTPSFHILRLFFCLPVWQTWVAATLPLLANQCRSVFQTDPPSSPLICFCRDSVCPAGAWVNKGSAFALLWPFRWGRIGLERLSSPLPV